MIGRCSFSGREISSLTMHERTWGTVWSIEASCMTGNTDVFKTRFWGHNASSTIRIRVFSEEVREGGEPTGRRRRHWRSQGTYERSWSLIDPPWRFHRFSPTSKSVYAFASSANPQTFRSTLSDRSFTHFLSVFGHPVGQPALSSITFRPLSSVPLSVAMDQIQDQLDPEVAREVIRLLNRKITNLRDENAQLQVSAVEPRATEPILCRVE